MPEHQLASPWWLLLLLALPVLAWLRGRAGDAPAMSFPMTGLLAELGHPTRSRPRGFAFNLLHLAMVPAIIALARPQKVISYDELKSEGIGIVVAFDVSLSMRIRDFYIGNRQVDRMTAAKRVLVDFIKGRPNDRIGIVAFGGAPYNPCPPTLDHDWLLNNMDRIQTGIMEDGTAIGSGIAAAARRLDQLEVKSKVILLMTDGANNSGKLSLKTQRAWPPPSAFASMPSPSARPACILFTCQTAPPSIRVARSSTPRRCRRSPTSEAAASSVRKTSPPWNAFSRRLMKWNVRRLSDAKLSKLRTSIFGFF
ncbi:VWA domain-containing protein [Verrucomicrobium spinosum]|uniref:VWA domain-containing protein n=1 Tax=Verrucomicrobium spinosum TaxID=2736 RepID=UPI00155D8AB6|nr:VWA domain-containing protein [Verrucomicrobium spinosum]